MRLPRAVYVRGAATSAQCRPRHFCHARRRSSAGAGSTFLGDPDAAQASATSRGGAHGRHPGRPWSVRRPGAPAARGRCRGIWGAPQLSWQQWLRNWRIVARRCSAPRTDAKSVERNWSAQGADTVQRPDDDKSSPDDVLHRDEALPGAGQWEPPVGGPTAVVTHNPQFAAGNGPRETDIAGPVAGKT